VSSATALILAGGSLQANPRLRALARSADMVIVADGGLRHVPDLDVDPTIIVGDFDSVQPSELAAHPHVPQQRHPADKGELDLELALAEAQRRGAARLIVMGPLGTRLDPTLAGLLVCARLQREGLTCTLHGTNVDAYPLAAGGAVDLDVPRGTTFSVVALDDAVVFSVRGAAYPVEREMLPFGVGLGVSNTSGEDPRVECHRGLLVAIVERTPDA
jgi:thiamine pyrophosphokinase